AYSTSKVPDDLRQALVGSPKALKVFETLDTRNRYAILFRIQTAVKPETRARRIATFVAMLEKGETIH
ncbi:MAG: YdeI/OmpD-associated family protein, partial [Gemmatimonadaceae bacterium]